MVSYVDVLNSNESLKQAGSGLVAVFAGGATNGIGEDALRALVKHTESPTIFVVGRSHKRLDTLFAELKQLNSTATLTSIIANDLTLIKDSEAAAQEISKQTKKIDLLIMSAGYLAVSRDESPEGLDRLTAVRHYSRMRFLTILAPQLRAAPSPRVVTVAAGGKEGQLWTDDWLLQDHYSLVNAAGAATAMTTLFFEEFSRQPENEKLSLVHLYPGMVGGTALTFKDLGFFFQFLLDWVAAPLMRTFGYTSEEAGERVLFAATNGRYRRLSQGSQAEGSMVEKGSNGKVGSGVYLVQGDSSVVTANKILEKMHKEGMAQKAYDHTLEELDRISEM